MIDANGRQGFPLTGRPLTGRPLTGRPLTGRPLTGRHVLAAMLGFFGCVIAVNAVFIFFALDSWTGLTDHDSYRTGLSWNRTLEADAARKALGWSARIDIARAAGARDFERRVVLELHDRDGQPIDGLSVSGEARHPIVEAMDTGFQMRHLGAGRYVGTVALPQAGDWRLRLRARRAGAAPWRLDSLMVVR